MSFPANPTNGQTTVQNGITFTYNSTKDTWSVLSSGTSFLPSVIPSDLSVTGNSSVGTNLTVTGNVGIGTSSPLARLNVVGAGDAFIQTGNSATVTNNYHFGSNYSGSFVIYQGNYGAGTERLRIDANGNVGIGTNSPTGKLNISGGAFDSIYLAGTSTNSVGITIQNSAASGRSWVIGTSGNAGAVSAGGFFVYDNTAGAARVFVDSSGHLTPGATNTYDLGTSSLRWRTIYTNDLELSNGIGDWTIVEGEDDLFIYNNKRGKVYKFVLTEVDPNEATPKVKR